MSDSVEKLLFEMMSKIDSGHFEEATAYLQDFAALHSGIIDNRFQAEISVLMKLMEYKIALKEFDYLRSISIAYQYCKMHYGEILEKRKPLGNEEKQLLPERDTIWWYWQQGMEKAPEIVRKCCASLRKLNRKIIILDDENIKDYISIPSSIKKKYEEGVICRANYSDLIRIELLTTLGGLWVDATTYITGTEQILPILETSDLFLYRVGNVSQFLIFDSWFIQARRPSDILDAAKQLLFAYWERENDAKHYFIFHLFMTVACQKYSEEYNSVPLFSNEPAHILQRELMQEYSDRRWEQIRKMSDVHKLTYKLDETKKENTFLDYLLH